MGTPPPLLNDAPPTTGGLRALLHEPTGLLGAAIVGIACLALSLLLWSLMSQPAKAITDAIPAASCQTNGSGSAASLCRAQVTATPLLAPLALLLLAFIFRKALGAGVRAIGRRLPEMGLLLPPVIATVVFMLAWAGAHASNSREQGLIPQITFPAAVGLLTYAVARWGSVVYASLGSAFDVRDKVSVLLRFLVAIAVPIAMSLWLAGGARSSAFNEQVVVLAGIIVSFLVVAPRPVRGGQTR